MKINETAVKAVQKARDIIDENHYNIASYRADNKRLKVVLPGE